MVALGIDHPVAHGLQGLPGQADVATLPAAYKAHPSLDVHLLAGPVHRPVVQDVPAQLIPYGSRLPGVVAPGIRGPGQDGRVVALAGNQQANPLVWQGQPGRALWSGDRQLLSGARLCGARCKALDGHLRQRCPILQSCGPDHHFAVVDNGVQPDLGYLDPGHHQPAVAVSLALRAVRFDDDDQVPQAALQGRAQVNIHLGQGIGLGFRPQSLVHHLPARWLRQFLLLIYLL